MAALTDAEIAEARADLEAELRDTVHVWRDTGTSTLDEDTLVRVPVWTPIAENTPALINTRAAGISTPNLQGESTQFTREYIVTLPESINPEVGDYIEVISCADSRTEGAVFTVRDVRGGSLSISRRLLCQDNLTYPVFTPEA